MVLRKGKKMTIAEKIRKIMREHDLSYSELSEMTGISKSSLQSYGSGRSKKVPLSVIQKLTYEFDLPIEYWLDVEDPEAQLPSEDNKTIDQIIGKGKKEERKLMEELLQLAEWYHLGMFTKEEFEAGKKFILEMMK